MRLNPPSRDPARKRSVLSKKCKETVFDCYAINNDNMFTLHIRYANNHSQQVSAALGYIHVYTLQEKTL